jgi:hypothetical protein
MTNNLSPYTTTQHEAASRITSYVVIGVLLMILGGVVIAATWSPTASETCSVDTFDGSCDDSEESEGSGRPYGLIGGSVAIGGGQMLLLAGIIGHGVALGVARAGRDA